MTTQAPDRASRRQRMSPPTCSPNLRLRLRSGAGAVMNARIAPASTRTAANATTVTAPVGASSRKEPNIPAALAAAPAIQPITSATPLWEENKPPTSAGTMRKQKTSKTPAVAPGEEATTTKHKNNTKLHNSDFSVGVLPAPPWAARHAGRA